MALVVLGVVLLMLGHVQQKAYASNFKKNFHSTWGHNRVQILNNDRLLTLSLDEISGSGFQSKSQYLFGKFDMKLKLVAGNSAGTVTTFYLASNGRYHDEIDFEFLGNVSGQPYTVHTNVFSQGKGDREQQFRLWFDPTQDFHTYSITWSPHSIIFSVDGKPIREFKKMESRGVPYPKKKPMKIYASLWSAEWATMGGLVKTDWTKAPFVASYGDFRIRACKWVHSRGYSCPPNFINSNTTSRDRDHHWMNHGLDYMSKKRLKMVQSNYKIYDYCTDNNRFPKGFPPECSN